MTPLPIAPIEQDDCLIMYTSGTTGKPKGALITHANMVVQNVYLQPIEWGISKNDRFLAITPLAHRSGAARLFNALGLGGSLVIMEKFNEDHALASIERERITVTGLVPAVIRMLLPKIRTRPECCASLRRIIVATEAFPVALKQEILSLLPNAEIHSLFGSTEVLLTNLDHAGQFTHPASVGQPLPGIEVRLVDDAIQDVPVGDVGELLVRSGEPGRWATFRGYFRQAEETAKTIRDGWVHTGDMARADAGGFLNIVDRKKDMVLRGRSLRHPDHRTLPRPSGRLQEAKAHRVRRFAATQRHRQGDEERTAGACSRDDVIRLGVGVKIAEPFSHTGAQHAV